MQESTNNPTKISEEFAGMKYTVQDVLNKKIAITNYSKEESTKHSGTSYYKIQFIILGPDGSKHLGFMTCGAHQIVEVLNQKPALPLYRTIVQVGRSFYFKENMASTEETIARLSSDLNIDFNQLKNE